MPIQDLYFHFNTSRSGLFFILAKDAAKRCHAMKGRVGESIEAASTIVMCALVAESAINQIGEWLEFHKKRPPYIGTQDLPADFYDREIRQKWLLLPTLVRQNTFAKGAEPWQSFDVLIDMRNYLVHLKSRRPSRKAITFLNAKSSGVIDFQVAEWSCNTVAKMFEKLTELVDPPQIEIGLTWLWTPKHSFPFGLSTPGDPWPRNAA